MNGAEIPRGDWEDFFEEYSLDHEGWIVDLEWPENDSDSTNEREFILEAIEAGFADGERRVVLFFNDREPIVLENPTHISLTEGDGWDDELIEIETSSETLNMHLRFPEIDEHLSSRKDVWLDADEGRTPSDDLNAAEEELRVEEERMP